MRRHRPVPSRTSIWDRVRPPAIAWTRVMTPSWERMTSRSTAPASVRAAGAPGSQPRSVESQAPCGKHRAGLMRGLLPIGVGKRSRDQGGERGDEVFGGGAGEEGVDGGVALGAKVF